MLVLSQQQIESLVEDIADQLNIIYEDHNPIILSVLGGSVFFTCDLMKRLEFDVELDFIKASSYVENQQSELILNLYPDTSKLKDRHIILVEDIIDSGNTITLVKQKLLQDQVKSLSTVSLLIRQGSESLVDIYGHKLTDEFVYGYGMDDNQLKRNLSDIFKL